MTVLRKALPMATKDEQDDQAGAEEPDSFGLVECRVEAFDGDEEPPH